ncbi:4-oxalocrotonate tautomerase DmpI [Nocardia pseudobrasiliensis]|nr:4-oxalocrotonate tautomerase DmpI [Nocardia pseudobrasiliensis]
MVAALDRCELWTGAKQPVPHQIRRRTAMPVVTVQQGPRTVELKRDLVRRITDAFVDAYQIPAETVQVWIQEVPTDSWGTAGQLTADK